MGMIILYELYHERISFFTAIVHAIGAGVTSLGKNKV
jgi:hypothetical protein